MPRRNKAGLFDGEPVSGRYLGRLDNSIDAVPLPVTSEVKVDSIVGNRDRVIDERPIDTLSPARLLLRSDPYNGAVHFLGESVEATQGTGEQRAHGKQAGVVLIGTL